MKKQYRYFMNGMFYPTDGNVYEINVPSPFLYNSKAEAMKDENFGYRFIYLDGDTEPILVVFESEKFEVFKDNREKHLIQWVEGNVVKTYTYKEFKAANGYIRMLKPECIGLGFIDGNTDFIDTDKTFEDVFPNMQKQKLYYIDNQAYYVDEIETIN